MQDCIIYRSNKGFHISWLHDEQKREKWIEFVQSLSPDIDPQAVRLMDEGGPMAAMQKGEKARNFKANLVQAFKERFPQTFHFGGNRSIDFNVNDDVSVKELKQCIALALTYH